MTTDPDRIKDLEAQLAKSQGAVTALLALSPDEFAHARSLTGGDRDGFIGKSAGERAAIVKERNEPLYTATDGTVYKRADGERLAELAKRLDASNAHAADVELAKRAEAILKHAPGDVAVRKALLSSVECISDEAVRKAALAILDAYDKAAAPAFRDAGTSGAVQPETNTARAKFDALVTKYASDKGVSKSVAIVKLTDGPERNAEACALYEQIYS